MVWSSSPRAIHVGNAARQVQDCLATRHPAENAAPMESCLDRTCMCWKNLVAGKPLCWKAPALIKYRPLPLPCVFWTGEQVSAPQQSTEKYSVAVAALAPASQTKNIQEPQKHPQQSITYFAAFPNAEFKLSTRQCLRKMGAAPANFSGPPGESASIALLCGCDVFRRHATSFTKPPHQMGNTLITSQSLVIPNVCVSSNTWSCASLIAKN